MKKKKPAPILVITSDRWHRDTVVVFDDDHLDYFILDDWVDQEFEAAQDRDETVTREEVYESMEEEFLSENSTVNEFWPELGILRCEGDEYYSYDYDRDSEGCELLGRFDSLEECQAHNKK